MDEEVLSRPAMFFRTFETAELQIVSTKSEQQPLELARILLFARVRLMQTESKVNNAS
jgi:hypothetical protein